MCPTYRAADEEILSTRGRANALRRAMSGELEGGAVDDEFLTEVLDLCIGCKGCARDCPSGVDMARMKAELTHEYHQREGAGLRERVFARIHDLATVGSALAPLSNWASSLPGSDYLAERFGIASEREIPPFRRETLTDWFRDRGATVTHGDARRHALLFPDTYTDHSHPEVGKAAVRVLEAAGVRVRIPDGVTGSGRPPYSKGFLDLAAERARENVETLAPIVDRGWDVVVVEPSDAVMFQDEYRDLVSDPAVDRVADAAYGIAEYLDSFDLLEDVGTAGEGSLAYHSHCHQHATKRESHAPAVLRDVGYEVDAVDSTCCGMAGSFGYESEHYSMSRAIGAILTRQLRNSEAEEVVAPGTSCRTQIDDLGDWGEPAHPIEKVVDALE
jgi:Fe-S oxidoreductase